MSEANKLIVSGFLEKVFNAGGDTTLVAQYVSPAFVQHEEGPPMEGLTDFEAFAMNLPMLHTAIPDLVFTITTMVAEGDKVAVLGVWNGTHQGEFMGLPATNNPISVPVFDLFRVEAGKIVEHWGVTDNMAMMTQLGAIPKPGSPQ